MGGGVQCKSLLKTLWILRAAWRDAILAFMNFPWELWAEQELGGGDAACSSLDVMLQIMTFQSLSFLKNESFIYLL